MTPMRRAPAEMGRRHRGVHGLAEQEGDRADPALDEHGGAGSEGVGHRARRVERHRVRGVIRPTDPGDDVERGLVVLRHSDPAGHGAECLRRLHEDRGRDLLDTEVGGHRAGHGLHSLDACGQAHRFLARLLKERAFERQRHLVRDDLELGPFPLVEHLGFLVAHEQRADRAARRLERQPHPCAIPRLRVPGRELRVAPVELLG